MEERLDSDNPYYAPLDSNAERVPSAARGQRLVLAVLSAFLSLSLAVIVLFLLRVGTEGMEVRLIRLALEIILAVATYRGYAWARYLLGGFAVLGVALGSMTIVNVFRAGAIPFMLMVLMLSILGSVAMVLLVSKDAKAFFASQASGRKK